MSDINSLETLKELYASEINSIRVLNRIHTLKDLILVLNDRDALPFPHDTKELALITAEELINAKSNSAVKCLDVDSLSKCIGADWLLLAEACHVEPKLCESGLAETSAKAFLLTLQKGWGRISRKEFLFRLKNYALDCGLNHLMSSRRRSRSKEKSRPFSFLKHRYDVESALRCYYLIDDWDEFWRFSSRVEALHLSRPTEDVNRRLFLKINVSLHTLEKRVSSRELTETRLQQLLLIVQAFLAYKQTEKFNKLRKLRQGQKTLPVAVYEHQVVEILSKDRVLIIAGDTGCGKSTQIPQYLERGCGARVICTQPRRLACVSLAARLKHETLTEYCHHVGYQIRFERRKNTDTKILFMTEGLLLRQLAADSSLADWDVVILDEVHERHLHGDLLLGLLTCLLQQRNDLKLVLMSATINTQLFLNYFGGQAQLLQVPGRLFPVDVHFRPISTLDKKKSRTKLDPTPYLQILTIIDAKYRGEKGDVLIFLSGVSEITFLVDAIEEWSQRRGTEGWFVLPLHGALALTDQDKVFRVPANGVRKCVVSTNISETSLTIDGIRFVIDSGKVKEMSYDPATRVQRLKEFWVSKSSAEQRKGRAGRTGPGVCFRVYSLEDLQAFDDFPTPEVRRVPLDSVLLQVIAMGLPDVRRFPFVEPPASDDLEASIVSLKQLDALTDDEKLTPTGRQLANLPVDVQVGKMLLAGCVFRQTELALLLAGALSVPNPLTHAGQRDLTCEKERSNLESPCGDPVSLIAYYRHWLELKSDHQDSRKWSKQCGLEEQRFYEITKLRMQFKDILTESGLLDEQEKVASTSAERRIRSGEVKLLKSMKAQADKAPKKRQLGDDDDDGELDVRDVEFRLRSDPTSVRNLLREVDVKARRHLVVVRAVFCSGLYPQFAIADEHNAHCAEPVYHTRAKSYVFLHPTSFFSKNHHLLQLTESDIVVPPNGIRYASRLPFSSRHQLLCYLGMLETTKVFLTCLLRMPALHTCLLFCKQIDTSFDFSKIICDNWLLFEPLSSEDAEHLILRAIQVRNEWSRAVEQRVTKSAVPVDAHALADKLEAFLAIELVYGIKRLLPADLNTVYTQSPDPQLDANPFDADFVVKSHPRKGGAQVTDYFTYACVIGNEGQDMYAEGPFLCPKCAREETFNALQRVQHRATCHQKAAVPEVSVPTLSAGYRCDLCQLEFSSGIQVLRHKKTCSRVS